MDQTFERKFGWWHKRDKRVTHFNMIGTNKSFLWDQQSRLVFRLWTELDRLRTCVCPGPCIKPTRTRHSLRLRTRVRTIGQRLVMWKPVKRRNDWKPRTLARTNFGRACPSISKYEIFGPILRFNLYLKRGQIWVKILGKIVLNGSWFIKVVWVYTNCPNWLFLV